MKKYLLFLLLLLGITSYSQEVTIKKSFNNSYTSIKEASKNSTLTTKFTVVKGVKYYLYTSIRGSYFIVLLNKEGRYYRKYVKIEE